MAQIRYRANLAAKDFVFTADGWGRSVVMKQYDQNFSRQIVSPTDPDKDIGIPQIFYCHNVMPMAQGFQSVSYYNLIAAPVVVTPNFTFIRYVNDLANNTYGYLGFNVTTPTSVDIWGYSPNSDSGWVYITTTTTTAGGVPYIATVNGQSYLYISYQGCSVYDAITHTLTPVTLTGLAENTIVGIIEAFGYMIAWSNNAVYWSSTISATDFTPSLLTGAGGGQVQQVLGNIAFCRTNIFGFVIYSDKNAVSCVYSGNSRYPFNFRPVVAAGGVVDPDLVDVDPESGNTYAFGTSGVQITSVTQAQTVFPELTNFLTGSRFEDFNDTTLQFSETTLAPGSMIKKLTTVANRYVVFSYGLPSVNTYTHAVVYDAAMKRWGKLKFTHTAAFEYIYPYTSAASQARESIGFMTNTGALWVVLLQQDTGAIAGNINNGTIILGKYQHARDRLITLEEVALENVGSAGITISDLPTLDGKTFLPATKLQTYDYTSSAPRYKCRLTGMNHSLIIQGDFSLDSLMLTYTPNGRR